MVGLCCIGICEQLVNRQLSVSLTGLCTYWGAEESEANLSVLVSRMIEIGSV